jgi:hypothetical protein
LHLLSTYIIAINFICFPLFVSTHKVTIQWKFFGYSKWRPLYRFNISNPINSQVFVDFMLKFYQLAHLTWIKPRVVKNRRKKRPECPKTGPDCKWVCQLDYVFFVRVVWCIPIFSLHICVHKTVCTVI